MSPENLMISLQLYKPEKTKIPQQHGSNGETHTCRPSLHNTALTEEGVGCGLLFLSAWRPRAYLLNLNSIPLFPLANIKSSFSKGSENLSFMKAALGSKLSYRVSFLTLDPWLTFRCQMTRSVPGGQRGSSKDPAEMSALWGNNSATFHRYLSLYSSSTQDTRGKREEGTGSQQAERKTEGRGAGLGQLQGAGAVKGVRFEYLIRYHTITVSSPPMRQTKDKLIRHKTQKKREKQDENRNQSHAHRIPGMVRCDHED